MASPISLNKPGLNNLNDLSNKIPGEPLPGQIMEISTVIIGPPGRIMEISTVIIRPSGLQPLGQHQNSLWAENANDPSHMGCNNIPFSNPKSE